VADACRGIRFPCLQTGSDPVGQAHRRLNDELVDNRKALDAAVEETAPELCELRGVGSVVAASVLTAWSHPGRVRSEAAFAALARTCPIPASSGNTLRHRLNRGGDRRLNRALTTVVIVRMRTRADPNLRRPAPRRRSHHQGDHALT
jgi:transposase